MGLALSLLEYQADPDVNVSRVSRVFASSTMNMPCLNLFNAKMS